MAMEIVDLSMKHGDFHSYVSLPDGNYGYCFFIHL